MTVLFDFAADIVLAHAEALKSSEQEPLAEERANVNRPDSATAASTDKRPSCSAPCTVIVLDDRRRR